MEPTSHAVPLVNVMRDDEPGPSLPAGRGARQRAGPRSGEFFRVPRIIEE